MKVYRKSRTWNPGNLSENPVHMRVSKGNWIYDMRTVGVINT